MAYSLIETDLEPCLGALPASAAALVQEGQRRSKTVNCFDFVPSNPEMLYGILAGLPRGRLCEWGSGIGIGVGLAAMLGFEVHGIEINPELAAASRELLADFGLAAHIDTGSYFEVHVPADTYFTYCWPGQMQRVEEHFWQTAPRHARLLIAHGAEDIRCKIKAG